MFNGSAGAPMVRRHTADSELRAGTGWQSESTGITPSPRARRATYQGVRIANFKRTNRPREAPGRGAGEAGAGARNSRSGFPRDRASRVPLVLRRYRPHRSTPIVDDAGRALRRPRGSLDVSTTIGLVGWTRPPRDNGDLQG